MRINSNHVGLRETRYKQNVSYRQKYYLDYIELTDDALYLYNNSLKENPSPVAKLTKTDIIQMINHTSDLNNPYIKYITSYK